MAQYVGILDGSKDVWGVRIPDIPGCHGGGASPEAAIADAISALREFAAHQRAKGIAIAPPRTVQDVMRDKEAEFNPKAGEAIVMVPLILDQARPVKANISLDAGLLEAIDEEAERRGLTRSALLTSAAIDKIINERVEKIHRNVEVRTQMLVRTLRKQYGANFAKGYRADATLESVLKKEKAESLHDLLKRTGAHNARSKSSA